MYNKFLLFSCCIYFSVSAQQSDFEMARSYFDDARYALAQNLFLEQLTSGSHDEDELLYFIARCSNYLSNTDTRYWYSLLLDYHEHSSYHDLALRDMSFIYFSEKEYSKSVELLSKINDERLQDDEFIFKLAYSLFMIDSLEDSKLHFSKVKERGGKYYSLSLYYYAHISYIQKLYQAALFDFKLLQEDKVFSSIVPYYITQIYFFQKQYQYLVDYAEPILKTVIPSREAEINRLIAESYYHLSNFDASEKYLKNYIQITQDISMVDYFQLGQINVFLGDYTEAIEYLEKVENVSDSLSQFSSYYLGRSYIETGNKNFALAAFKKASDIDVDLEIKEESLYNYFKLCYELDMPYTNLAEIVAQMEEFRLTKYKSQVRRLMIDMFQSTNQYQQAFDYLKHNHLPKLEEKETLQRLSYYIGVQHYNNANYNNALLMFEYSRRYPENKEIDAMSVYWLADCYFQLGDINESIVHYKKFLDIPSSFLFQKHGYAKYNLAYSYFNSKEYYLAAEYFQKAINADLDDSRQNDSYLRLADSYYMLSDFMNARRNYDIASYNAVFDQDYALYQQSRCSFLLSEYQDQEQVLLKIEKSFKESPYIERVFLDLAELYKNVDQNMKSLIYYDKVLDVSQDEEIISSSFLNKGLIYFNLSQLDTSIFFMKKIISEYPRTRAFKGAKMGLKESYLSKGNLDEYFNFINNVPNIDITSSSKDSLMYELSYSYYKKQDYINASNNFQQYLSIFGELSIFFKSANFYCAESYWATEDSIKAIALYQKVISLGKTEYLEPSLVRLSRHAYETKDYESSNVYYSSIDSIASSNSLRREALIRLMMGFEFADEDISSLYSRRVLDLEKVDDRLLARAKIIIARSDLRSGNYARASDLCNDVVLLTSNRDGAEAMYLKCYFTYLEEDYDESERLIFLMPEKYSSDHWIAKAFILLSDIYVKLENFYQAKATLESVIENHNGEDLVNQARKKWEDIVERESNQIHVDTLNVSIGIGDTLEYEIEYSNDLEE